MARHRLRSTTRACLVATTISFNLQPGVSLSDAVSTIESTMNRIGVPATIRGTFQGTAKAFQDSLANQPFLIWQHW